MVQCLNCVKKEVLLGLSCLVLVFFLKKKVKPPQISVLKEMPLGHEVSDRNMHPPASRLLPLIDDDQKLPFPTAAL